MIFRTMLLLLLITATNISAQNYFEEEYSRVWQRSTTYTKNVAEAMPEEYYDYKIHSDGTSFKEQQLHIISNISFLTKFITGEYREFYAMEEIAELNKGQILDLLDIAFEYVAGLTESTPAFQLSQIVEFKGIEMSKENIFYLIRNHMTHHRAQSIIYLRLKGIEAPDFVGW